MQTRVADPQSFVGDILVIDSDGHPTFVMSNPDTPRIELADLPYFKALKADPADRVVIDPTRVGRAVKEFQFRVARSIRINGVFKGVVVITLRPDAIIDLFQQFRLGENSTISVMQTDEHRYIARLPVGDRSYFDKAFDRFELWDRIKEAPHGVYHNTSLVDHVTRYFAYQKAAGYPIASSVGVADMDIDAGLAETRRDIELEVLFFTIGAVVICALVLRIIRVEDRLRRSNANLEHAQRMGRIGSVEVDLVTMKPMWSEELYRIYGRDRAMGPATLDEFLAYVHPDDRPIVIEMRDQHTDGTVLGPNEYRIVLKDGAIRWIHREVEVVLDASGKPVKLVASEQDVTERKLLDQAKDGFVSTVSHELRTPLTSIRGALGLIASGASGALPEKTMKLFDIAHRNSERLSRLVNDLLDLQRIGDGRMAYRITDIVLSKVVTDAIEAVRPLRQGAHHRNHLRLALPRRNGARRCRADGAGDGQPALQRDQILRTRPERRRNHRAPRFRSAHHRRGSRRGYPRGLPRENFPALLPGRFERHAQDRRLGPGAQHRPRHCHLPRRHDRLRVGDRQGHALLHRPERDRRARVAVGRRNRPRAAGPDGLTDIPLRARGRGRGLSRSDGRVRCLAAPPHLTPALSALKGGEGE